MKSCATCDHVVRPSDTKNPKAWLCDRFPWNEVDNLTGEEQPPYRWCRDVLRLTCPNNRTPCVFFEPTPETGEPVIKESGGEKSVTFKPREKDINNG